LLITVDYHDDLKEVQGDAALASLLSAPAAAAPFDRMQWWQGLEAECGLLPLIAVAREGEERAALPLHRVEERLEALANWYSFRVRPVISQGGNGAALLNALARDLADQAPRILLAPLPDENGETTRLAEAFRRAGWMVFRELYDTNHVLHLCNRSYNEYLASRPGTLRTTLKRKAGKVSVTIENHFNPASWQAYEGIYAKSWKPGEGSPAFLRRFAHEEGAAGRIRLGIACAEGEPVAAQFWTVENGTAFIHKLAHLESAKALSPGTTLSAALFRQVIDDDRVALVDFGTGDDGYKRDWMESIRPRYRLDMLRPGIPGNWPIIAKAAAKAAYRRLAPSRNHG
jgi:CelD/BcsL family acetyltransferase involved in cellulose biosynthesis